MKTLKAILNCGVDLIFGAAAFGLVIWYMIDQTKNFTSFIWLVVGYVVFNIINKVQMNLKQRKNDSDNSDVFDPYGSNL